MRERRINSETVWRFGCGTLLGTATSALIAFVMPKDVAAPASALLTFGLGALSLTLSAIETKMHRSLCIGFACGLTLAGIFITVSSEKWVTIPMPKSIDLHLLMKSSSRDSLNWPAKMTAPNFLGTAARYISNTASTLS